MAAQLGGKQSIPFHSLAFQPTCGNNLLIATTCIKREQKAQLPDQLPADQLSGDAIIERLNYREIRRFMSRSERGNVPLLGEGVFRF